MAKIALITPHVNLAVESLATALQHQKQDVTLVTSKQNLEFIPTGLDARGPFQKWNSVEAIRAIPSFLGDQFDVWHFVFSPGERPQAAHWFLATLARSLPNRIVAGSFAGEECLRGWNSRFLKLLDLALFSNRSLLMQAKRRQILSENTLTEVIPPLEWERSTLHSRIREDIPRLIQSLRPYLVLPDFADGPEWLDHSPVDFVILKPTPKRGSTHPHLYYVGDVTPAERKLLLEKSLGLCLLYGEYSELELQRFHDWSEQNRKPLLVWKYQTEVYPGLCWHLRSGWVLPNEGDPLQKLFVENPQLELPQGFQSLSRQELMDSTLNELLRLYQRSFRRRWA